MAFRFNPAPGWPPAPANWTPPPGWTPPAEWSAAPAEWQWWVEDDPGYPGQPPPTVPPVTGATTVMATARPPTALYPSAPADQSPVTLHGVALERTRVMGRRILAMVLDLAIVFVLFIAVSLVVPLPEDESLDAALGFLLWGTVFVLRGFTQAAWGASPGQRALGLMVLAPPGRSPGGAFAARNFWQFLFLVLPFVTFVSWITGLSDPQRRMLHDKASRTAVVRRTPAHYPSVDTLG